MPGVLGDLIDAIQTALSQIPPAALVIGLLFGPTVAWIVYRVYAGPRVPTDVDVDELYWICASCRSANDVGQHRCYHCHADRDAAPGALRIIDHDQFLEIEEVDETDASPGVPVGPGRRMPSPPAWEPRPPVAIPIAAEDDAADAVDAEDEEDDVVAASQDGGA